jgi:hypothetical protein
LGIPAAILDQLCLLEVDQAHKALYLDHYQLILEAHPHLVNILSEVDFMLAYIAAEYCYAVLSSDHHLDYLRRMMLDATQSVSQRFLDYDLIDVAQLPALPIDTTILLDSNMFLMFAEQSKTKIKGQRLLCKNMQKATSLTYLLLDFILEEIKAVYHQKYSPIIEAEGSQSKIALYVENFEGFAPKDHHRGVLPSPPPPTKLVAKRFRYLIDK